MTSPGLIRLAQWAVQSEVSVRVSDSFVLDGELDDVWSQLCNVRGVSSCIPGLSITEQIGPDCYQGKVRIQFGPTVVTWSGEAAFAWDASTYTVSIKAKGVDGRKASRISASVDLALRPNTQRGVNGLVSGDIAMHGPLSGLLNTGGTFVVRAILADFETNLARQVAEASADLSAQQLSAAPDNHATVLVATPSVRRVATLMATTVPHALARLISRAWRKIKPSDQRT